MAWAQRAKLSFTTATVKRGSVVASIGATEPLEVVDVGAQVAGRISAFGKDKDGHTVDYGSVVEEGALLAKIDDSVYAADLSVCDTSNLMKTILLLSCLACTLHAADTSTLKLLQTIPLPGVKGRFDHFAIDTKGQRLFIAALGNNTLEVVDLAAGKRIRSISGMSKPTGVLYLSAPNQVIVANGGDGTLKVLSGSDYKVLQSLAALPDADNLRFDPKSKLAWLGYGEGALGAIDTAAAKSLGSVKLPAHPESFQLEKEGNRIFVNVPDAKQVAIIDRTRRTVVGTWPMETFQANFPMALDEPNHRLFVGCRQPARLVVLDTATGKTVADLGISGDIDDLFHDATRKRLYLSCGESSIDTIQQSTPDTYQTISKLPTAPGARTSFFSPDLDRLYLAVPNRGPQQAEIRVYEPR